MKSINQITKTDDTRSTRLRSDARFLAIDAARQQCLALARIRHSQGLTVLCQAVNRLWQDTINRVYHIRSGGVQ